MEPMEASKSGRTGGPTRPAELAAAREWMAAHSCSAVATGLCCLCGGIVGSGADETEVSQLGSGGRRSGRRSW